MFGKRVLMLAALVAIAALTAGFVVLRGQGSGAEAGADPRATSDRARIDYVENLLAKEQAGKWTRAEGLVATLKLFEGEANVDDVLLKGEVIEKSGTGIIAMAQEYLVNGDDDKAKAEVQRLLDQRLYTTDELATMAGGNLAALPRGINARPNLDSTLCSDFFEGYTISVDAGPCVLATTVSAGGQTHRIWKPIDGIVEHGWTKHQYGLAESAVIETANAYSAHGKIPPMNVVFYVSEVDAVLAEAAAHTGSQCGVGIMTSMQSIEDDEDFKTVIAHEIAHCFQEENFDQPPYEVRKWREEGLADYMPNLVYPASNYEWETLGGLNAYEYDTTLFERSYTNFVWFQFLKNEMGVQEMFQVVRSVADGDQAAQLAGVAGMQLYWQTFQKQFTDATIMDDSGLTIPTKYHAREVELTAPQALMFKEPVKPFGVRRALVKVAAGKQASLELGIHSADGEIAPMARPLSARGQWADIPLSIPEGDGCEGERTYLMVATAVHPDFEWELHAPSVKEPEECEETEPQVKGRDACLVGTWVQDLDVLSAYVIDMDPPGFHTVPYSGEATIEFKPNGFVEFRWVDLTGGYTQDMTDAHKKPMDIGGTTVLRGRSVGTWEANGHSLQYGSMDANVWMRTKLRLQGKITDSGWKDVSHLYGGGGTIDAKQAPAGGGAGAPSTITLGRPNAYTCHGDRLEMPHSKMPWTLVWNRRR